MFSGFLSPLPSVEEQKLHLKKKFALEDVKFERIITYLQTGHHTGGLNNSQRTVVKRQTSDYSWDAVSQKLYIVSGRKKREVVRTADGVARVLHLYHTTDLGAHIGYHATFNNVKQHYYWRGIKGDTMNYVAACDRCRNRCKTQDLRTRTRFRLLK
ncbi:Gypsy retrotransposon integrase-like protein 1 [Chionoecetes opilio]|uniref:Gypsy retrotransposon integrase-like protein 1 n=1 Tax=Chionoecetes opilio TaxID=41210 RepID=A0A8J5D2Q2_CHIOP|nr:Gypsy retrotransposon integrase-like protein 1 [Chionoecetes opilio]